MQCVRHNREHDHDYARRAHPDPGWTGRRHGRYWVSAAVVVLLIGGWATAQSLTTNARTDAEVSTHRGLVTSSFQSLSQTMQQQLVLAESARSLDVLEGGARVGDGSGSYRGDPLVTSRSIEQRPTSIVTKLTVVSDSLTTVMVLRASGTAAGIDLEYCTVLSDVDVSTCANSPLADYAGR